MYLHFKIIFIAVIILFLPHSIHAATHPFLLVKESEYPVLIERKNQEPWKSMHVEVLERYNRFKAQADYLRKNADGSVIIGSSADNIRDVLSSATLLYIIDPVNKDSYKSKIIQVIKDLDTVYPNSALPPSEGSDHTRCVRVTTAYFNAILALDVIYNDISADNLSILKKIINDAVVWYRQNPPECNDWPQAIRGLSGTSALFNENYTTAQNVSVAYKNELFNQKLSKDGVYGAAITYAQARLGSSERTAKSGFMHVSEYMGFDTSYYSSKQLQRFTDWYTCAAYSPINTNVTFGDTYFDGSINIRYSTNTFLYGAGTFSQKAASCAAWRIANGARAPVDFVSYVLVRNPLPAGSVPKSDVWPDGMASFWDENQTTDTLMGALWNNTVNETHKHPDTNAIFISGYGEDLVANSGYMGSGGSCCGFTESYIRSNTESSNTVTINNNAFSEIGGTITNWLLSDKFDFARGKATLNTTGHNRDFYFVHTQDSALGYFVTNDSFTGVTNAGVQIRYHPTSADYSILKQDTEYRWRIKREKTTTTYLNIFLGNTPGSVQILDGLIGAQAEADAIVGKYMKANYSLAPNINGIATVIFPTNDANHRPVMTRISESGVSGIKIEHPNGETDFIVNTSANETLYQNAQMKAKTAIFRMKNSLLSFYHGREATKFMFQNVGFESAQPVSIHIRENRGEISSPVATSVTLYKPGITGVRINGTQSTGTIATGSFTMQIPAGNSKIELLTTTVPTDVPTTISPTTRPTTVSSATPTIPTKPGDANKDGTVDGRDYILWLTNYNLNSTEGPARGDFNLDGKTDRPDYLLWLSNYEK